MSQHQWQSQPYAAGAGLIPFFQIRLIRPAHQRRTWFTSLIADKFVSANFKPVHVMTTLTWWLCLTVLLLSGVALRCFLWDFLVSTYYHGLCTLAALFWTHTYVLWIQWTRILSVALNSGILLGETWDNHRFTPLLGVIVSISVRIHSIGKLRLKKTRVNVLCV